MSPRNKAFSLVELLVVIGIIGILLAVLLPTLGKVRKEAGRAACLNNLRQIAQMTSVYATSNQNNFPINSVLVMKPVGQVREEAYPPPFYVSLLRSITTDKGPHDPAMLWYPDLQEKYSAASVLHCPSEDSATYQAAVARQFVSVSGANVSWLNSEWKIGSSYSLNGGVLNKSFDSKFDNCWTGGKRVRESASTVLAYDGKLHEHMFMVGTPEFTTIKTTVTMWDVLQNNDKISSFWRYDFPFDTIRHRGKLNIVFFDGHAITASIGKELESYYLLRE